MNNNTIMETIECDGRKCGEGKFAGGNKYVCPHNNLAVKHPHLIEEFDSSNTVSIYDCLPAARKNITWRCKKNPCGCHIWAASINCRTGPNRNGCPYCVNKLLCDHNNLEAMFPELKKEWDVDNVKEMCKYPPCSGAKVSWICSKNPCGCHKWTSPISARTSKTKLTGCPYCANLKICDHTNLKIQFPDLIKEWDYEKNLKPMESYAPYSNKKVHWICSKQTCGCHKWVSSINNRTSTICPRGCPYCVSRYLCEHNNLEALYPELKKEWDPNNLRLMCKYAPHSQEKVSWICAIKNDHNWSTEICGRTDKRHAHGCPHCSKYSKCSAAQINWLTSIEKTQNITIRHGLKPEGELKIPKIGRVDGYCETTNTVYEFHGDYWHGNPSMYNKDKVNPNNKKLFGDLYEKTINRDEAIKNAGYNLVVKWETEF